MGMFPDVSTQTPQLCRKEERLSVIILLGITDFLGSQVYT